MKRVEGPDTRTIDARRRSRGTRKPLAIRAPLSLHLPYPGNVARMLLTRVSRAWSSSLIVDLARIPEATHWRASVPSGFGTCWITGSPGGLKPYSTALRRIVLALHLNTSFSSEGPRMSSTCAKYSLLISTRGHPRTPGTRALT